MEVLMSELLNATGVRIISVIWCDNVGVAVHWSVGFEGAFEYAIVVLVGSVVVVVVICIVPEESSKMKGS